MPGNDEQKIGNDRTVTDPVIDRPVVLVGMMGVGKSSIGKRLAARLNVPFADADDQIERAAGISISDPFEIFGLGNFPDRARRSTSRLSECSH